MKKSLPLAGTNVKNSFSVIATLFSLLLLFVSAMLQAQCPAPGLSPVAGNDAGFTTCYGSKIIIPISQLLSNDADPTGGNLSVISFTSPSGIDVKQVGNNFEVDPKSSSGYVTFTYTVKKNDGVVGLNGHYYKYVPASTSWSSAKALAEQSTFYNRKGYLATITSLQENDFIKANFPVDAWLGASDEAQFGTWKWVTGPEGLAGQLLSFKKWGLNQPPLVDSLYMLFGNKNYMSFSAGNWIANANNTNKGYIIEYGDMETGCMADVTATATVTIYVNAQLILNGSQQNTCSGGTIGSASIFATGGTQPYTFDHFTYSFDNGIDASLFALQNGSFSANGQLTAASMPNYSSYQNAISTKNTYADLGFLRLQGTFKMQTNANVLFGLAAGNVPLNNYFSMPVSINFNGGYISTNIAGTTTNAGTYEPEVWYDVKIEKKGTAVSFFARKAGDIYWSMLSTGTYNGQEGAYAVAGQYYADNTGQRGFYSKNWKLSFNPETVNLSKGEYNYTVIDALGCMATKKITINDNINFSLQSAITHTSILNAADGTISISTGVNPIASITNRAFASDFSNNGYNPALYTSLGSYFITNGNELRGNKAGDVSYWKNSFVTKQVVTDAGYISFTASARFDNNTRAYVGFATTLRAIQNEMDLPISFSYKNGTLFYNINGVPMPVGVYAAGIWLDFKIEKIGTLVKFYVRKQDEGFKMVGSENYTGNETSFKFGVQYYGQNSSFGAVYTKDWVVSEAGKLSGLKAGNYVYTVTSEAGCSNDVSFTIYDPLTYIQSAVIPTSCYGSMDGKINVTAQGGKTPYQFSTNGASFSSSLEKLAAGTYPVQIKDALGNVSSPVNVEVTQPVELTATIASSGATDICVGSSVTLSTVTNAVSPVYKWSNNALTGSVTTTKAGTFSVKVTDATGCSVTSDAKSVVVHNLPEASITISPEANPCIGFTMTAHSDGLPGTFEWKYGTSAKGAGRTLTLWPSDKDGVYSLWAINPYGCKSATPATYTYVNKNLEVSYAIVGTKQVTMNEGASVTSGSIGVTASNGKATFHKNTAVNGSSAFVKAKNISVGKPVDIPNQIKSAASELTMPDMLYNTAVVSGTSILQKVNGVLSGNYKDITIKNGSRVIITGSVFGKVQIEDNCEVTFTSTDLSMDDLTIKNNNDPTPTIVHFAQNTNLKVRGDVLIEQNCQINPEEVRLNVFVGTITGTSLTFEVRGYGTDVRASVYVPDGQIRLNTDDVYGGKMKGLYIAESVVSLGKKAVWSAYSCDISGNLVYSSRSQASPILLQAEPTVGMKVDVFPNPAASEFQLVVKSDKNTPVTIIIVDAAGKVVERIIDTRFYSSLRVGANLRPGVYFAQVLQGDQKQTIKLLKL